MLGDGTVERQRPHRDHLRLADVGGGHDQPHEAASDRGTPLSRRRGLALALVLVGLAMVWGGGGLWLARRLDARDAATVDALARAARAPLDEAESLVRREAGILAQDAAVVDSVARHDAAALARGAVRIRTLTLDGEADCVLIVDDNGGARSPSCRPISACARPIPCRRRPPTWRSACSTATRTCWRARPSSPRTVRSAWSPSASASIGWPPIPARPPSRWSPAIACSGRGCRVRRTQGWGAITRAGHLVVGSERWLVRPAGRVGDDTVWALIPERLVGRERGWLWAALIGIVRADRHERGAGAGASWSSPCARCRARGGDSVRARDRAPQPGAGGALRRRGHDGLEQRPRRHRRADARRGAGRGRLARRHGVPAGRLARTPDPDRQPRPDARCRSSGCASGAWTTRTPARPSRPGAS